MQTIYKNQPSFNLILDVPPVKQGIRQFWTLTGGMVCQASCRVEDSEVEVSLSGLSGGTRIDRRYGVGRISVEVV